MVALFCGKRLILSRGTLFRSPKRHHGYIVLVPEIGEDSPQKNPLLKDDKLPEFSNITIEKCIAAIARQTVEFEDLIKSFETKIQESENIDIFEDVLNHIEEAYVPLETTWGIAQTMYFGNQSLMPTKSYMSIHERASRATAYRFINKIIHDACKQSLNDDKLKLTFTQKRILEKYILNGKFNGLDVPKDLAGKFDYSKNNTLLQIEQFKEKLQVSTKLFSHTIRNPDVVRDFPDDFLKNIAADPAQPYTGPWTITLQRHIFQQFMEYCPDRSLRQNVWEADVTRASVFQDSLLQTSTPLEHIRSRRIEQAKILGYENYAEMSMETKMAGNLTSLYKTMDILLESAYPAQEQELKNLNEFAKSCNFEGTIQIWDIPYWGRKQYQALSKYQDEFIKNYFPLPKVLSGLFQLTETLYNVRIVERKVDSWHQDVRFFDMFDLNESDVNPIASFYFDPYARGDEKIRTEYNSGWHVGMRAKSKIAGTTPLAALIFNFQPPAFGKPALLSFKDLQILFQKFGHGLQYLLTTVDYVEVSGLSFVEWDAAFISDFFMENWLYEPSTLHLISGHYETGEPLPENLVDILRNSRSHLAGYHLCRELYLSRFDLELHRTEEFWTYMMKRLWQQHFALPMYKKDSHVCSFESIFSGAFGAAYYSHLWSKMIAADLFSALHESSKAEDAAKQKEIGNRYRQSFLSLGGSYSASEIFRRFRGRDPSPKALLNTLGIKAVEKE